MGESRVTPCVPGSYTSPIPHELQGWGLKEIATGVPMYCWVQWRISVLRTLVPSICHGRWLFVGAVGLGNNIEYVLHSQPCPRVLGCFLSWSIDIWLPVVYPIVWVEARMEIDKRDIAAPCVLLVSIHFYLCGIYLGSLELSSRVRKFAVDPVWIFSCCWDTCRLILFLTVGFMGLRCITSLSVQ